jgi:hypothetical protein
VEERLGSVKVEVWVITTVVVITVILLQQREAY